jgi:hypothetical protein
LGFLAALSFSVKSEFGLVPTNYSLGAIDCSGNEMSLDECSSVTSNGQCWGNGGAGVVCKDSGGMTIIKALFNFIKLFSKTQLQVYPLVKSPKKSKN